MWTQKYTTAERNIRSGHAHISPNSRQNVDIEIHTFVATPLLKYTHKRNALNFTTPLINRLQ